MKRRTELTGRSRVAVPQRALAFGGHELRRGKKRVLPLPVTIGDDPLHPPIAESQAKLRSTDQAVYRRARPERAGFGQFLAPIVVPRDIGRSPIGHNEDWRVVMQIERHVIDVLVDEG